MMRPLMMCLVLCLVHGSTKPTEIKKDRVHKDEPLSKLKHDDKESYDFDHEAFLGQDDAKTFDELAPEESQRRLGIIVDKIDRNKDGFVSEEELKDWLQLKQRKHILESVEHQWVDFDTNNDSLISWAEYKNVTYGIYLANPKPDPHFNYSQMMTRDEKRFKVADRNGDLMADKKEFGAFLHPEDHRYMKDIVVEETMQDIDKNRDGFVDENEYIADMYIPEGDKAEPDWVLEERKQFSEFRDKNHDGKLDREETKEWILPSEYEQVEEEARHLIQESDTNADEKLTKNEILNKYEVFVGSQVTDYGQALLQHDEF